MNLEDQVAPLDLAQRLAVLGFPQDTEFAWFKLDPPREGHSLAHSVETQFDWTLACAAPTVAEMGEWLPNGFDSGREDREGYLEPMKSRPWRACPRRSYGDPVEEVDGATEAEVRARLLIALAESGALDPKALR